MAVAVARQAGVYSVAHDAEPRDARRADVPQEVADSQWVVVDMQWAVQRQLVAAGCQHPVVANSATPLCELANGPYMNHNSSP